MAERADRKFFRDSNIWQLIGILLIITAILIPHGSAVLIDFGKTEASWIPEKVTGGALLAITGVILALWPIVKEGWAAWRKR